MPRGPGRRDVQLPIGMHTELTEEARRRELSTNALVAMIVRAWLDDRAASPERPYTPPMRATPRRLP